MKNNNISILLRGIFVISLLVAVGFQSMGQSRKERKKYRVKSTTEYETAVVNGAKVTYREKYEEFDKEGRVITSIEYEPDGSIRVKMTAKYNGLGLKTAETEMDVKKNKNVIKTFRYNAMKDKTEESEFAPDGTLLKRTEFSYDVNGNRLTETEFDASGTLLRTITYTYNNKELKVARRSVTATGEKEKSKSWEYEYY